MTNPVWRKSSRSGTEQNACVEVARLETRVGVRDSKNIEGGHLVLDQAAVRALVGHAKAGDLDL
ncbi:DUF397 domain-containing protein [Actinomadura algeriensis]|uniref:DUF397 domain-containing protein n=1 Tax=Actinomadura algeriensis TaxID=1679523 RepID=A0ABR9JN58_9ACTN|nr:DUF397 domain-containing protein [Actinomadura algeriensis]MBE1531982.1 hypothetical protein [Actinomadura algeriensis]